MIQNSIKETAEVRSYSTLSEGNVRLQCKRGPMNRDLLRTVPRH